MTWFTIIKTGKLITTPLPSSLAGHFRSSNSCRAAGKTIPHHFLTHTPERLRPMLAISQNTTHYTLRTSTSIKHPPPVPLPAHTPTLLLHTPSTPPKRRSGLYLLNAQTRSNPCKILVDGGRAVASSCIVRVCMRVGSLRRVGIGLPGES